MKSSPVTTTENPLLAAFSGLRRRLRPTLSRWLGEDEADDALQEAFCRLWPERERWADADEAARVLNVTARHIGIDELRRRQKLGETSLEEGCDPTDEADAEDEAAERYRRVKQIIDSRPYNAKFWSVGRRAKRPLRKLRPHLTCSRRL